MVRTTRPGSPQKSVKLSTGADTETGTGLCSGILLALWQYGRWHEESHTDRQLLGPSPSKPGQKSSAESFRNGKGLHAGGGGLSRGLAHRSRVGEWASLQGGAPGESEPSRNRPKVHQPQMSAAGASCGRQP